MAKRKRKASAKRNQKRLTANRNYKDTVFRMLFSDRKNLLSFSRMPRHSCCEVRVMQLHDILLLRTSAILPEAISDGGLSPIWYNAVNGTTYENPEDLEIVTLENAIYMGMKNDLAFIIDTGLFLYEHQSTYNPNIPLRDLFYISSEYQKLVDHKSLYASTLQKIPAPNFLVFYNGTEKKEDRWVNYLSEAYETRSGDPSLELKVITLNINEGHNKKLMEQCRILREYAQYVGKVRNYTKEMELDAAVERAVEECIREGILAEFLRKHKAEVVAMSIFEYDKEKEEKKLRKAEYEAGFTEGIAKGEKNTKIETAKALINTKMSVQEIAEILKTPKETVEEWIKDK